MSCIRGKLAAFVARKYPLFCAPFGLQRRGFHGSQPGQNLGNLEAWRCPMQRISAILPEVLISAVLFSGCGGGNLMKSPPPPQALQPSIVAISPPPVPAGSGGFALTITGTGLSMNTQVKFGSAVLMPTSVAQGNCPGGGSCTVLTVNVPAQNVANAGTIIVSVANSSMVSNDVAFAVTPQSGSITGAPQLLLFSPMIA